MPNELATTKRTQTKRRDELLRCLNVLVTGIGYKDTSGQKTLTLSLVCPVTESVGLSLLAPEEESPSEVDGDVATDAVARCDGWLCERRAWHGR